MDHPMEGDIKVIQCNFAETTNIAPKGARAYITCSNNGNGNDRIPILVRSHGGRWVEKWERADRLTDFRLKTLPPEHPLYSRFEYAVRDDWAVSLLESLSRAP